MPGSLASNTAIAVFEGLDDLLVSALEGQQATSIEVGPRFGPPALGGGRRLVGLECLLIGTDLPGDAAPVHGVRIRLGCVEGFSEECEGSVGIPFCGLQQTIKVGVYGIGLFLQSECQIELDARLGDAPREIQRVSVQVASLGIIRKEIDKVGTVELGCRVVVSLLKQVTHLVDQILCLRRGREERPARQDQESRCLHAVHATAFH